MTIETKYNIGDEIIFIRDNKIETGTIIGIRTTTGKQERDKQMNEEATYYIKASGFDTIVKEPYIFPDKESLIKSL